MPRAFLAVQPPEAVLDAVASRLEPLDLGAGRPTPREQWHLTVQFLGDDADLDAVAAAFDREPLGVGRGEIALGGAKVFGRPRRAQVLALGLSEGVDWMRALFGEVARRLRPLGYGDEDRGRPFVPHLTVARFRAPTDLRRLRDAIGTEPTGRAWRVDEIVLFRSRLGAHGAHHEVQARLPVATP